MSPVCLVTSTCCCSAAGTQGADTDIMYLETRGDPDLVPGQAGQVPSTWLPGDDIQC